MRITLFINSLTPGGAQRVATSLANAWAALGHDITVCTTADAAVYYPLAEGVSVRPMAVDGRSRTLRDALRANAVRVVTLRKELLAAPPDVLITFMDCSNVLAILATIGTGIPTIVCEHTDPARHEIGKAWSMLRVLTYPLADAVTVLTDNVYRRWRWLGNASVMPNPIVTARGSLGVPPKWIKGAHQLLAVGRLSSVKGFDRLLQAFSLLSGQRPEWNLTILGRGARTKTFRAANCRPWPCGPGEHPWQC